MLKYGKYNLSWLKFYYISNTIDYNQQNFMNFSIGTVNGKESRESFLMRLAQYINKQKLLHIAEIYFINDYKNFSY